MENQIIVENQIRLENPLPEKSGEDVHSRYRLFERLGRPIDG